MVYLNTQQQAQINFGRRLTANEIRPYSQTVKQGLNVLGKELDIILHNSAAPSFKKHNTGIGSLLSVMSEKILTPFLGKHGITSVQMDPDGLRKGFDGSPYVGDTFAKNVLMIPLEKLKSKKYGSILSKETFQNIVNQRPNKETNRVDYSYVVPQYEKALKEAFNTFKTKSQNIETLPEKEINGIKKLNQEFIDFKQEKSSLLEKNAIYSILSDINKNDYWKNWSSELDKNLFNPKVGEENLAKNRIAELKQNHSEDIDFFMFKQMLVSTARKETNEVNTKNGIKTIGDSAVAFSNVDVWANQQLFKKDWSLGCPPDFFSADGQAWGFEILEPNHLFKKDGSLGKGGELLFQKYETMFQDNQGGVRIDHLIGLIDPFVYKDKPTSASAGRLFSSPNNPDLAQYAKNTTEEYANIIQKIVIPAAKKAGLESENIICEDLGTVTEPTLKVIKSLNLRGIAVTQYVDGTEADSFRGKNVPAKNLIMIGSHDNVSFVEHAKELFAKNEVGKFSDLLSRDILPETASWEEKMTLKGKIESSPETYMSAKFTELFTSPAKKVQVFFTDLLGMSETYNKPGTAGDQNWSLRMQDSFEKDYHKNLGNGVGLNLPEVLSNAIKQKGNDFVKQNQELLASLDKFAKILKEKE
ncbi:MAG: 4-alpha-glucanotransferase [bacterium]